MPRRHKDKASMDLVPYNPRASPQRPQFLFSEPLPWLRPSPPSSSTSSSRSSHYKARKPKSTSSRGSNASFRSARNSGYDSREESDAESSYTGVSQVSAQTFGDRNHPAYAPGQAPRGFYYNYDLRYEWETAGRGPDGRKVRSPLTYGSRERGFEGSQWGSGRSGRNTDGRSANCASGWSDWAFEGQRGRCWDGAMISPPESDNSDGEVSSIPSRTTSRRSWGRRESERYHSPPSSEVSWGSEEKHGGEGELSIANGRLVRVQRPRWVR